MTATTRDDGPAAMAADLALAQRDLDDADTALADRASDLRSQGVAWAALAAALGVVVNSAKERYGCRPRPYEVERLTRRAATYGATRPKVTAWGRFVVADLTEPRGPGGVVWRIVRSCATEAEAATLVDYLDEQGAARRVRRPVSPPTADTVVAWRLGHAL